MAETLLEETQPVASTAPAWIDELTQTQRRDIKACLPFPLKALGAGSGWAWHSEFPNLTASVKFGEKKNSLIVAVSDDEAGEEIELWRTELHLTGQWKRRLRQLSGEALVLCQSRPRCPKCSAVVKLIRRNEDRVQFFGCSNFRSSSCNGSLNIIDHDVERPS